MQCILGSACDRNAFTYTIILIIQRKALHSYMYLHKESMLNVVVTLVSLLEIRITINYE